GDQDERAEDEALHDELVLRGPLPVAASTQAWCAVGAVAALEGHVEDARTALFAGFAEQAAISLVGEPPRQRRMQRARHAAWDLPGPDEARDERLEVEIEH